MKRLCALFVALMLLAAAGAAAEDMWVVNCENWVSLREGPSADTARLAEVPLGALVNDCAEAENGFVACSWQGQQGYIRADYLAKPIAICEAVEPAQARVSEADELTDGVLIWFDDAENAEGESTAGEDVQLMGVDANGSVTWALESKTPYYTELQLISAIPVETQQGRIVLFYNAEAGLAAIDPASGEILWTLSRFEVPVGGSVSWDSDGSGLLALGGNYVTEPVLIDVNAGTVLWKAQSPNGEISWLYEIHMTGEGIECLYDFYNGGEDSGVVVYDTGSGKVLSSKKDE